MILCTQKIEDVTKQNDNEWVEKDSYQQVVTFVQNIPITLHMNIYIYMETI